jgi:hypothetical protein
MSSWMPPSISRNLRPNLAGDNSSSSSSNMSKAVLLDGPAAFKTVPCEVTQTHASQERHAGGVFDRGLLCCWCVLTGRKRSLASDACQMSG